MGMTDQLSGGLRPDPAFGENERKMCRLIFLVGI